MPKSVQRQDLRDDVLFRLNLTAASGGMVETADVDRLLDRSVERLCSIIVRASGGEDYFTTKTTLTTTADQETVTLPTGFWKLRALRLVLDGESYRLARMQPSDHPMGDTDTEAWTAGYLPRYRLDGTDLVFWPKPKSTHTLHLEYVQMPVDFSGDSDTLSYYPGWDEWVVLDSAIRIRQREAKPYNDLANERDRVQAEIEASATPQDEADPPHVRRLYDHHLGTREAYDWSTHRE